MMQFTKCQGSTLGLVVSGKKNYGIEQSGSKQWRPDLTPHFVSHKKDARLIWVNTSMDIPAMTFYLVWILGFED